MTVQLNFVICADNTIALVVEHTEALQGERDEFGGQGS
jgi:hypothetical protein